MAKFIIRILYTQQNGNKDKYSAMLTHILTKQ